MHSKAILICGSLLLSLTSCFEKEKPMPPYIWTGQAYAVNESIYSHSIFFELNTNSASRIDSISDWDLSFESAPKGWHIRINSGKQLNVYRTDVTDFSTTQFQINFRNWLYDNSNGDPDSTAVGAWVNTAGQPYSYSGKVYLIGQNGSSGYKPIKKIMFAEVTDTSYRFTCADLNGDNKNEVVISKDTSCNYSYFNLTTGKQVIIEPPRDKWDFMFTQYLTTLYANGLPVPYFVRGVLINPYKVLAAVDSTKIFDKITINDIPSFHFKKTADVIGYDWKSPQIDVQTNTARYTVKENYNFIILDTKGDYYKLRFLNFYNASGEEGFPTFIFKKL